MNVLPFLRRLRGPTLVVQIVALLLAGLVIAQAVTLLLTLILPPTPVAQYNLKSVATALRSSEADDDSGGLQHIFQPGPPELGGRGWLTSERSRAELAQLLGAHPDDVRLSFFTPLPFAGTVGARKLAMANDGPLMPVNAWKPAATDTMGARLILAQAQMPVPPAFPPGGQQPPQGTQIRPPTRGMLPPDALPRGPGPRGDRPANVGPNGATSFNPATRGNEPLIRIDPTPLRGTDGVWIGGDRGETVPPLLRAPDTQPVQTQPIRIQPGQPQPGQNFNAGATFDPANGGAANGFAGPRPGFFNPGAAIAPQIFVRPALPETRAAQPANIIATPHPQQPAPRAATPPVAAPAAEPQQPQVSPDAALATEAAQPTQTIDTVMSPDGLLEPAIPLVPRERGLFGLAPVPFVEGDFVAALRLPDGRWSVVQPAPEPFPNAWQRRILLWFMIAFAIVAPVGWLFARRLVTPLARFAEAAEALGRDPTAPVLDLDGPAEVGRAAHAFNIMQSRLKSFVGDRTAMIGAISHDLRTPLTRLRFRIEEVDDEAIRDGMIEEVEEMEAMITSVLSFIRDASAPGIRERLDLRTIVEDVAEDAVMIGGDVSIGAMKAAQVEVDVMGMRRLLANLLENALKYGTSARVSLSTDQGEAVAEILDEGPGVPEDDLERAFEPFYRAANARGTDKRGNGLGLAVCRSIARAHGGDVMLVRSAEGFKAQLRIPLAFDSENAIAA